VTHNDISWETVEQEAVELLSRYIQINTTNPPGKEMAAALFLKQLLDREGIACDIYESQPGRGNIITRYQGNEDAPEVLLLHHMDVVPAEAKKWTHPPFSGTVADGEVWGRGAIDCKSLGIMEYLAFILLKRRGFCPEKYSVLAATADEEAGGAWGVKWLMENHPDTLKTRSVINESAGLGFSSPTSNIYFCQVAEKGICWLRIIFTGIPGHASMPHDENCVAEMAKALDALSRYCFPVCVTEPAKRFIHALAPEQAVMPENEFLEVFDKGIGSRMLERIPDKLLRQVVAPTLQNTCVPTVVRSGDKANVIPSECFCEVDCRILPGCDPRQFMEDIRHILRERGCTNFTVKLLGSSAASVSPVDTRLFKMLEKSLKKTDPRATVIPYMSPGATDSRFFRDRKIPAYGLQMESSVEAAKRIHAHNERINAGRMVFGIKVLFNACAAMRG